MVLDLLPLGGALSLFRFCVLVLVKIFFDGEGDWFELAPAQPASTILRIVWFCFSILLFRVAIVSNRFLFSAAISAIF